MTNLITNLLVIFINKINLSIKRKSYFILAHKARPNDVMHAKTQLKRSDSQRQKLRGRIKKYQTNGNNKKVEVAILISENIIKYNKGKKVKNKTKYKEGYNKHQIEMMR